MRSLLLAAVIALGGCFSPDQPICAFRCDPSVGNNKHCPENYSCHDSDGYCHLNGSTGSCPFAQPDLLPGEDASAAADLTSHD